MNAPIETVLAELRSRLEAVYGPRLDRVILFGSRARGDADADSDIDVMIILKERVEDRGAEKERYMDVAADLSLEFDTVIVPILTDIETHARSGLPLYRNVRREGVAL